MPATLGEGLYTADGQIDAEVYHIAEVADEQTGLFEVEVLIPNDQGLLRPGMVATADLVTDSAGAASSAASRPCNSARVTGSQGTLGAESPADGATAHRVSSKTRARMRSEMVNARSRSSRLGAGGASRAPTTW